MSPIKRFFLIVALTAMWSPSFLFIKLAISDLPPFTIVYLRLTLAMFVLCGIVFWKNRTFPRKIKFWLHTIVTAFLTTIIPYTLFCYAEQTIDSALAAIINGSTPMFTAILAQLFIPSDRLTPSKIIGIGLSTVGLLLLFAPNFQNGVDLSGSVLGMLASLGASLSYAASFVYAKKNVTGYPPFVAPASMLIVASFVLLPTVFIFDAPLSLPMPSLKAICGVCGLALFGTIFAFTVYYKLLEHCGPTSISMVACFFPVVGMLLGFIFLGEDLSLYSLGASTIILLGMMTVSELIPFKPKALSSVQ